MLAQKRRSSGDSATGTRSALQLKAIVGDGPIFEDPRQGADRRIADNPEAIPVTGCRRKMERRSDRINLGFWWMKRNYNKDNITR